MFRGPRRRTGLWLVIPLVASAGGRSAGGAPPRGQARVVSGEALRVVRGDFEDRILLTGELEAARAELISVPRVPSWQVSIRWLEADGAEVQKGQKVAELDPIEALRYE